MHEAVSNSGPLIHLNEIDSLKLPDIFDNIIIAEKVVSEVGIHIINKLSNKKVIGVNPDEIKSLIPLTKDFKLETAEMHSLYLSGKLDALFLTDDLEARKAAKKLKIDVHGSIGVIVLAYKRNILTKAEAKELVLSLYNNSTLFLTRFIVDVALKELDVVNKK